MPRPKSDLTKVTFNMYTSDLEKFKKIYRHIGHTIAMRLVLQEHVRKIEKLNLCKPV
jgi:hypothetical protein